jgi:hypothetical protein
MFDPLLGRAGYAPVAQGEAGQRRFLLFKATSLFGPVKRIDFVMPDLIRHPEPSGSPGCRLSPE